MARRPKSRVEIMEEDPSEREVEIAWNQFVRIFNRLQRERRVLGVL